MKTLVVIAILLAFSSSAWGQAEPGREEAEEICRGRFCRQPASVPVRLDEGGVVDAGFSYPTPYVYNGVVSILPGETVMVEAVVRDDKLVDLVAVPKVTSPSTTLVFKLVQGSIGNGVEMLLTVENGFPVILKYRLGTMPLSNDHLRKASSCPLIAGGSAYEHWGYPLLRVVAGSFHQVAPDAPGATTCE